MVNAGTDDEGSMKRIYISGPMTGLPEFNFPAFHAAAAKLRERGHAAVNPAEINAETGGDWHYYMKADIRLCATATLWRCCLGGRTARAPIWSCTSRTGWAWRLARWTEFAG